MIKNAFKFRVGQDVYYTSNYDTTEIGKIQQLKMNIKGSEH